MLLAGDTDGLLPYLAPELALTFHARRQSSKGEHAFDVAEPHLDREQRASLLARLPPDHRWRSRLST